MKRNRELFEELKNSIQEYSKLNFHSFIVDVTIKQQKLKNACQKYEQDKHVIQEKQKELKEIVERLFKILDSKELNISDQVLSLCKIRDSKLNEIDKLICDYNQKIQVEKTEYEEAKKVTEEHCELIKQKRSKIDQLMNKLELYL